ncbi:MAG: hypothetical protein AB9846_15685 [Tenuifilaceae bacterium]
MNQKKIIVKQTLVAAFLLFTVASFISCEEYVWDPPKIDLTVPISFQNEIVPIFNGNCKSCHGGAVAPDLRADKAYDALINGNYVNTADPENSSLYTKLFSASHAPKTSDIQKQQILGWITQGALNN